MQIIRITDKVNSEGGRLLYSFLEDVENFTLYECKNRRNIILISPLETLVLDHLDESLDPNAIVNCIINEGRGVRLLVISDKNENFGSQLSIPHHKIQHLVYDTLTGRSVSAVERDRRYFSDIAEASKFLHRSVGNI